ncbi:hypothetical protein D3C80_1894240 [compost metagenome]
MPFGDFIEQVVKPVISQHPDAPAVDFASAQWRLDDQPFAPQAQASLTANRIGHKSMLHLHTPGLTGIAGTCN